MHRVLGNKKKGKAFIVSGPAGTGKTTLVTMLINEFECVKASISSTTREPRSQEKLGEHYNFLTKEDFEQKIDAGEFLEYVQLFDHYYGTSKRWVEEQLNAGNHVILTIDTQGALKIKKERSLPVVLIFVTPPSLEELEQRIRKREEDTEEMIQIRLKRAKEELAVLDRYDYNVVNDDLTVAYDILRSIVISQEHKLS